MTEEKGARKRFTDLSQHFLDKKDFYYIEDLRLRDWIKKNDKKKEMDQTRKKISGITKH